MTLTVLISRRNLVDEPVADVDAPRIGSRQVSDELLEGRRVLEGILGQDPEQDLGRSTR
jgi:hypothetical protein